MRKKARTTSNLRAGLLRTRQNDDFIVGVESQTFPLAGSVLIQTLPAGSWRSPHITGVTYVTDITCPSVQHRCVSKSAEDGESGIAMSTIEEVRAAEKKVQEVLEALKKAGAQYPNDLGTELKNATDEYARAVRELSSWLRTKARRVAG